MLYTQFEKSIKFSLDEALKYLKNAQRKIEKADNKVLHYMNDSKSNKESRLKEARQQAVKAKTTLLKLQKKLKKHKNSNGTENFKEQVDEALKEAETIINDTKKKSDYYDINFCGCNCGLKILKP